jgi:hypothetical protein
MQELIDSKRKVIDYQEEKINLLKDELYHFKENMGIGSSYTNFKVIYERKKRLIDMEELILDEMKKQVEIEDNDWWPDNH